MPRTWSVAWFGILAAAMLPGRFALAQAVTVSSGQTVPQTAVIADGTTATALSLTGGGTYVLNNILNSYSGGTTVSNSSTLQIDSDAELGATTGAITLGDAVNPGTISFANTTALTSARGITLNAGGGTFLTNSTGATLSGAISGVGALTVGGGGILTLTNTGNSYSGGTVIAGGSTLQVDSDSELGSTAGANGGAITLGGANTNGTLSFVNTTAAFSSARAITLNAGGGTFLTNSTGATLSGVISGTGPLTVGLSAGSTAGVLTLSGANTYTGQTYVNSGATLAIGADTALGGYNASSVLTTNNALNLNGGTLQFSGATTVLHNLTLAADSIIDTNGTNDVISSVISGTGGLTKINAGVLTLTGINTYTGDTTVSAGELDIGSASVTTASLASAVTVNSGAILGGTGSVLGSVLNNGTVAPGVGGVGTLTVANYTQGAGGVLSLGISTAGVSRLNVTGTASLAGNVTISFAPGFLHPGTYVLYTSPTATTTGAFTSVTGAVPSIGLKQQIITTPTEIEVVLTQLSVLPYYPTVIPALTTAAVDEAQQVNQTLLGRLQDARSEAMADDLPAARSMGHRIQGHSPFGTWVQPLGTMTTVDGNGATPGFKSSGYGFLTGIDGEYIPGVTAGLAIGFNRTTVNEAGGASGTIDVPHVALYGGWWRGAFAIDALAGYGRPNFDTQRPIATVNQKAKASYSGSEASAALQASLNYNISSVIWSTATGGKYLNLSEDSFTEHGTDIYNVTANSTGTNSLRPFIGTTLSRRFSIGDNMALVPQLRANYEYEVMDVTRRVTVQTEGDDANWVINGITPSRGSVSLKAGVTVETSKDAGFFVNYDRIESQNSSANAYSAGFRYRL